MVGNERDIGVDLEVEPDQSSGEDVCGGVRGGVWGGLTRENDGVKGGERDRYRE